MADSDSSGNTPGQQPGERRECLQKEELQFWERQTRCGDEVDLKLARDLPDDTPEFILSMLSDFEKDAAGFCFEGAEGRVLDAGCGNGNLLLRALEDERLGGKIMQLVGMDFSCNMLGRAACRGTGDARAQMNDHSINTFLSIIRLRGIGQGI